METFEVTASVGLEAGDSATGVKMSGDTILVDAPGDDDQGEEAGAAYVFIRNDAGTPSDLEDDTWEKQAKLVASDGASFDAFGRSADIQGDTIVIGADQKLKSGPGATGAAYVFQRTGDQWSEVAKLTASDAADGDRFGVRVAIDGDTIVVGAFEADANGVDSGAAYVFVEPIDGWASQTETAKLTVGSAADGFHFGRAVDVDGDTVLVSAIQTVGSGGSGVDVGPGAAYVFERRDSGTPANPADDTWVKTANLQAVDGELADRFGERAVLAGNHALITATWDDHSGFVDAGSAYLFRRQSDGSWTQSAWLTTSDASSGDQFGRGADMEEDTIVVGAGPGGEIQVEDSGSIYFFERQTDGSWVEQGEVTSSDAAAKPCSTCYVNSFGTKLDLQGGQLVAGDGGHDSRAGAAFFFTKGDSSIVASDLFESGSFSDGLGKWASDGGWTKSGDASVRSDGGPHSGRYHARLRRGNGDLRRVVDVTGLQDVRLRFWSKLSSFESSDQAHVQVSGNGASWTTLTTFVDGQDDNRYHFFELDVPDVGDTLYIRFDAAMSNSRDYWYVDNVEVTGAPVGPPSQPPSITSIPVTTATEDSLYSYDVNATDPDVGDTLTFSLDVAPVNMTIDANTGLIQWTPSNVDVVHPNPVTVRVADQTGASATQSFDVLVTNVNDAPLITSAPIVSGSEGAAYVYDVDAYDPDAGDTATYSLDLSPSGMTIDAHSGVISWIPQSTDVGAANDVIVRVTDSKGIFDTQLFSINVSAPSEDVIYVSDIWFQSRRRGRDWRAYFEVHDHDSNPITGVQIEVVFAGKTFRGTTDANGIFRTSWMRKLSGGDYYAEAVDLAFAGHDWDQSLGWSEDHDEDGLPDALLVK